MTDFLGPQDVDLSGGFRSPPWYLQISGGPADSDEFTGRVYPEFVPFSKGYPFEKMAFAGDPSELPPQIASVLPTGTPGGGKNSENEASWWNNLFKDINKLPALDKMRMALGLSQLVGGIGGAIGSAMKPLPPMMPPPPMPSGIHLQPTAPASAATSAQIVTGAPPRPRMWPSGR